MKSRKSLDAVEKSSCKIACGKVVSIPFGSFFLPFFVFAGDFIIDFTRDKPVKDER